MLDGTSRRTLIWIKYFVDDRIQVMKQARSEGAAHNRVAMVGKKWRRNELTGGGEPLTGDFDRVCANTKGC
ncbi:MAG: hypothetical protein ACU84Q_10995 [Gammaproteobacteria bacterium]